MRVTNRPLLNRLFEVSLIEKQPVLILSNTVLPDIDTIKKECNFINYATIENFNESLKIDIDRVPYSHTNAKWEFWEDVFERVERAKKVNVLDGINQASDALLKTAYERLKLTELQKSVIIKTAKNIAKLDNSNNIRAEHIAEAISYQYYDYDEYIQSIELNIKYLQGKLKNLKKVREYKFKTI